VNQAEKAMESQRSSPGSTPEDVRQEHIRHIKNQDGTVAYLLWGDDEDPKVITALGKKMEIGEIRVRHSYTCERIEVIVQGSLDTGERVLTPGDMLRSRPKVFYGPYVAGSEGCTTVSISNGLTGSYVICLESDIPLRHDVSVSDVLERRQTMSVAAGAS
jgi:hypothetical protein